MTPNEKNPYYNHTSMSKEEMNLDYKPNNPLVIEICFSLIFVAHNSVKKEAF